MPELDYKSCYLPGVEEAKCFPNEVVAEIATFC